MKKMSKFIAILLVLVLITGSFTSCASTVGAGAGYVLGFGVAGAILLGGAAIYLVVGLAKGTGEALSDAAEISREKRAAQEAGRKRTFNEIRGKFTNNGYKNRAEQRLMRRTSEMTGGITVDVTPFLLHELSFAVIEGEVYHCRTQFEMKNISKEKEIFIFEFDISAVYEFNNEKYSDNLTVIALERTEKKAKSIVEKAMRQYAADSRGVSTGKIKKFDVTYNATRTGDLRLMTYGIKTAVFQKSEQVYYQFDVEVEYQKIDNIDIYSSRGSLFDLYTAKHGSTRRNLLPSDFSIFNKVYRSNLRSLAGASIDVQLQIWKDARDNLVKDERLRYDDFLGIRSQSPTATYHSAGDQGWNLPIINFVRVAKYSEE